MIHTSSILSSLSLLALCFIFASASPIDPVEQNIIPLCEEIQCPVPDCDNPIRVDNECCPICIAPDITPLHKDCMHNGEVVAHGELFQQSPCSDCFCHDGDIVCSVLDCNPLLKCTTGIAYIEGVCCPVCQESNTTNTTESSTPEPPTEQPGCSFNGEKYPEGATWHPSYPPHGLISCINCTCTDSRTECARLPCPAPESLPPCSPDDTIDELTLCCPKCRPVTSSTAPTPSGVTTPTAMPTSNGTTTLTISPPSLTPCTSSYSVEVWRHASEDAVAAVQTDTDMVKSYRWSRVDGVYLKEERYIDSEDFARGDYNFLGWALKNRLNGLLTRENKRRRVNSCTSDCAELVIKLLRVDPGCP